MVVCWRLDRLGRNLRHFVVLLEELQTTSHKRLLKTRRLDETVARRPKREGEGPPIGGMFRRAAPA